MVVTTIRQVCTVHSCHLLPYGHHTNIHKPIVLQDINHCCNNYMNYYNYHCYRKKKKIKNVKMKMKNKKMIKNTMMLYVFTFNYMNRCKL